MASLRVLVSFRARPVLAGTIAGLAASVASAQITIPTVPVGNPGNALDPTTGFGSVAYTYNIGTYEVTAGQYTAFLNAVAATDTNGLYYWAMQSASAGPGITRSGTSGSYAYSINAANANRPVNYVSFWDACRFANWLHNGQPTGAQNSSTTEDGAYTLTPGGISANTVARNAGWQWAVTSENEWYKAAYYQPGSQGGDADDYWLYPTSSNSITTADANYALSVGHTTPVGSYAANFHGTFDMAGNVGEWNDTIVDVSRRGTRGGFYDGTGIATAHIRLRGMPSADSHRMGFRISQVPGPSSAALLALGGLGAMQRRRR